MKTRTQRQRRPRLESLEGRLLLSASDLDPTFGGTGLVTNSLGYSAQAVVVQPNSKVIVAGTVPSYPVQGFGIIRYNTDGSLDTSFNGTGTVTTNFKNDSSLNGLALVPGGSGDEKLVAVGQTAISVDKKTGYDNGGWAIARYNVNGTLDTTFGDLAGGGRSRTGKTTIDNSTIGDDYACAAVVQPDGKIIVVGPGGGPLNEASGYAFEIIRLNTNGTPDTSFNGTGKVVVQFPSGSGITGGMPYDVTLDSQGRILVTGLLNGPPGPPPAMGLVRLNADGSLDSSFDGDGIVIQPPPAGNDFWYGFDVGIQSSGQIVVAGQVAPTGGGYETFLARFNTDGSLDSDPNTGFGPSHTGYDIDTRIGITTLGSMCVQSDDKLVLTSGVNELRVTAAGLADPTFGTNGLATQSQCSGSAIAMAPDGKIVVAGGYNRQFTTMRLMGDSSSPMMAAPAGATATQPDAITTLDDWDHVLALLAGSASPRKRAAGFTALGQ